MENIIANSDDSSEAGDIERLMGSIIQRYANAVFFGYFLITGADGHTSVFTFVNVNLKLSV